MMPSFDLHINGDARPSDLGPADEWTLERDDVRITATRTQACHDGNSRIDGYDIEATVGGYRAYFEVMVPFEAFAQKLTEAIDTAEMAKGEVLEA